MNRMYRRLAVLFFGKYAKAEGFQKMKPDLEAAGIRLLLKSYVSVMLMTTVIVFIVSLFATITLLIIIGADIFSFIALGMAVPVFISMLVFMLFYLYPHQRARRVSRGIDNDLPFALSNMAAISTSGISPEFLFEILTGYKEYEHIAKQASLIVRNIKTFGMSSVKAISLVSETTPSPAFKQVLTGITGTIEKGGDLSSYLNKKAERALFDYRIKREKYLKTLSTYADIYTALLVAAPLMMLALLGILSVIGGQILGLPIPHVITLLTFVVLPALNIAFLTFIHMTYPGV